MQLRVFTLGFDPVTQRFDDTPVRDFLADKVVDTISDHFFQHDGRPYLALVVRYRPASAQAPDAQRTVDQPSRPAGKGAKRDESWRDTLESADWPVFNRLREWRAERSKAEGIPPYVICNNRQLAEVVRRRPTALAQLAEVEGFGDAKLKKYGAELIDLLVRSGAEPEGGDAQE